MVAVVQPSKTDVQLSAVGEGAQLSNEPVADPSVDKARAPPSGAEKDSAARSSGSVLLRMLDEGGRRLVEEVEAEVVELMESAHKTNQLVSVSPRPLLICQPSTT